MLDTDIFRNRVAAPRAAAQRQGRCKVKVVQVADTAVRGRGIDHDTARFHTCCKLVDLFSVVDFVHIERSRMTVAAVPDQLVGICYSLFKILRAIHCQHRREFFMCKFFADVHRGHFPDQHPRFLRDRHAGEYGNGSRPLSYDLAVQCSVDENGLSYLFGFLRCEEIAATLLEFFPDSVIDAGIHDDRLLRSTDHAVVECL